MNYIESSKEKIEHVINLTHKYYLQCEEISDHNNNLIGLYFHEIIRFFSTTISKKEIKKHRCDDNRFLDSELRFGYRNGVSLYDMNFHITLKRKFVTLFSKLPIINKRPTLYLGYVSINNLDIIKSAYLKGYKVVYLTGKSKVYIDKFNLQNELFTNLVYELCTYCGIESNSQLILDIDSALHIVDKHTPTCAFTSEDIVLIGTPAKVVNRKASVNAFYCNIKVIGVLHSDEAGAVNLPSWRYDDRSNCTHIVGYGPYGDYFHAKENMLSSLSGRDYIYLQSDSETCRKIYNERKDISMLFNYPEIYKQKGLYVSSRIGDISVINPYPVIDPLDYIKWQEYLLVKFPKIFVKKHPKQSYKVNYKNIIDNEINLSAVVDNCTYDFFIVDSVSSTAFSLIASTNRPIIYFNIESPKLTKEAVRIIKKRVLWVDINIFDNYKGFEKYEKLYLKNDFINNYTSMYSLSEKKSSRINTLSSIL